MSTRKDLLLVIKCTFCRNGRKMIDSDFFSLLVCCCEAQMATHDQRQKGQGPHKKKICKLCGDVGFQIATVTGHDGKDVDVHEYCQVDCYKDAPDNWCCEKCVKKQKNEISEGSEIHVSTSICQSTLPPEKRSKFLSEREINWKTEEQIRKTKYLPVEEAIDLLNSGSSRVMSTKSKTTETRGNLSKPRTQISDVFPKKRTLQYSLGLTGYKKPHSFLNFKIIEPSIKQVESSKGPGGVTILEHMSFNVVKASGMMNPPMTHPCDPALAHSWKGSFEISGASEFVQSDLNNFIQAHPPSKVKRKVYEFSGQLPHTLKFELVPRGKIWTKLFNNHCPGKEDVGLYFFTSERERSGIYTSLVEYMRSRDFVMRTVINDVELLVLASTTLHNDSQKLSFTL
ncbi:hypothetical protein AABB24_006381 [Solanum stoloniferum]|uniref:AIPP2-like SPOC-like domain-containing protein n=1 Tax=Solanum stoloniferum TaxID=62892 RepID=A0ABD2V403_9SOLN